MAVAADESEMPGTAAQPDGVGGPSAIDVRPLFEPFALEKLQLSNRFVLPGMQRGMCEKGAPTAAMVDYYRRRVAGGCGLIISESVAVDLPTSTQNERFAWMTERTFDAWVRCIAGVKEEGARILLQIWHEGARRTEGGDGPYSRYPTISPSGIADRETQQGRPATLEELGELKAAFVSAALMAKAAGADGVEIHAAHGYLLDQFLWPVTNRREDGYGGSAILDRARLPSEIIAGVRAACGPDFVIGLRFSQWKETDYSARVVETPEELQSMLSLFETAGLSIIHASTRRFWSPEWPGSNLSLAGWCKRLSHLPVICVGSVGVPTEAGEPGMQIASHLRELVRRLASDEFDLVSVGRSQIADPDWVNKVRAAELDSIRPFQAGDTREDDQVIVERAKAYSASTSAGPAVREVDRP
jgi:2,4-dienoyl-CoA reductase-like NADH-dependent reductase (Old Yellow Enzyme family)